MSWETDVNIFLQSKITSEVIISGQLRTINSNPDTAIAIIWKFDGGNPLKVDEKWYFIYKNSSQEILFNELVGHIE